MIRQEILINKQYKIIHLLSVVWSTSGPVPVVRSYCVNVQSKSLTFKLAHLQNVLWSNVQLLSAGVIVVGGRVGGAAFAGMYVHGER